MYTAPAGLSPTPSIIFMTIPTPTPVTEEHQDGVAAVAESDPMTTQIDSISDGEPTEGRGGSWGDNGLKRDAAKRGRRNSKSSRVSGRERKAMKVLPVVVGKYQNKYGTMSLVFADRK